MKEENISHIEFLAKKSSDFIDRQVSAYRQKQANSGTIMAITSVFIPFFLGGLDESYNTIKLLAVIPIALFIYSIYLFIEVLKSKSLDQGFHTNKFQELANYSDYKKVLLYEIGANKSSFDDNKFIVDRANRSFSKGIRVTLLSVLISIGLLVTNTFVKPVKIEKPYKIQIVK
jgi:hypothetical protein